MPSLDELKAEIKQKTKNNPERFFAVNAIKQNGFFRSTCQECGTRFWSTDPDREVCGEPDCSDGYTFINDPPTEKTFDVVSAWETFSAFMEDRGYTPIARYPVAARWRTDTEVVRASIYDFQPYVVTGAVEPPANPLVVPQFCFRSNDIDNVGITGRHYTGFIMVGQHAFTPPEEYRQQKYFTDMLDWLLEGMGIPKQEIILHEDAWGGGGNLGACMEFFVRGLELFNQVYMFYEVDPDAKDGYQELDTKVLDMGMGHERIVWITHGSETSYEANMPRVVTKLYERTGVEPDKDIWSRFLPHSGALNLDEVDDIEDTWNEIAADIGVEIDTLKEEVLPAAHLYAIADHTRTLLVALNDGLLPSNAGERHALRVMVRRCFEFIEQHGWEIDLGEVLEWHANEFGELYPELQEHTSDIKHIIQHEKEKWEQQREEAERLIEELDAVDTEQLVELYDSRGITPEMLQRSGVDVEVPSNFYQLVAERHTDTTVAADTEDRIAVGDVPDTERLYWEDEYLQEFDAQVLKVVDDYVILDKTAFYPTSGGQEHDTGLLDGVDVVDVIVQDNVILHKVHGEPPVEGETVQGVVDWERRTRLRKHHTATHLINAAARELLGNHVWQAGSHKSEEKARLDITHYDLLDRNTLQRIEDRANDLVAQDHPLEKTFLDRSEAEQRYGFRLYQGGAVPGNRIRVVDIPGVDAEACGGTHTRSTGEVERIRIIGSTKVQDGTIRIEYVAGDVAEEHEAEQEEIQDAISDYVTVDRPLEAMADIFDVEVEHLPRVVKRFTKEWAERKDEVQQLVDELDPANPVVAELKDAYHERPRGPERLFNEWKQLEKDIARLESQWEDEIRLDLKESSDAFIEERIDTQDVGMLIRVAKHVTREHPEKAVLLIGANAVVGAAGEESDRDIEEDVGRYAETVQGNAQFAKGFELKEQV